MAAVSRSSEHGTPKRVCERITLLAGLGVEGDAHMGATVKHRSRVRRDPTQPNLRQVHPIHSELHDELSADGVFEFQGEPPFGDERRGRDAMVKEDRILVNLGVVEQARELIETWKSKGSSREASQAHEPGALTDA